STPAETPSYSLISQRTNVPRSNLLSANFTARVTVRWNRCSRSSARGAPCPARLSDVVATALGEATHGNAQRQQRRRGEGERAAFAARLRHPPVAFLLVKLRHAPGDFHPPLHLPTLSSSPTPI